MKIHFSKLFLFLSGILVLGCSTVKQETRVGTYTFIHDDKTYEIISIYTPDKPGSNYLQRSENGVMVFRAFDSNSDGRIDTVLVGDHSLEMANLIYGMGIREAIARGAHQSRIPVRIYEYQASDGVYTVQTFDFDTPPPPQTFIPYSSPRTGEVHFYNAFIFVSAGTDGEEVYRDRGADGVLNLRRDNPQLQGRYREVLESGIREGKIEVIDRRYIVKPFEWSSPLVDLH